MIDSSESLPTDLATAHAMILAERAARIEAEALAARAQAAAVSAEADAAHARADPQAWLADVLVRINDHAVHRLDKLLPWNWRTPMLCRAEAA